ncbi:RraA family protein [Amnibacterium endophyticum]|uniref:Putative 4-hydroxy-4-methyl-2-oxoglutarate aldolase n=1 Tax=Amnibacterium endophyticum TaxID=2109337 RepID=A0ABW4LE96_9MICO
MAADPFPDLAAAHVADACVRLGLPLRTAALAPVAPGVRIAGHVLPARHSGSVDVFLEAFERAEPGDVLVVDDGGRRDEACVGDLVALEAQAAGIAGIVIWGCHRDSAALRRIGLPVFSLGALPNGPERARAAGSHRDARVGPWRTDDRDVVIADDDGVLVAPAAEAAKLAALAAVVRDTEAAQAARMREGRTLREQTEFARYLRDRAERGTTFRQHLRSLGAAVEE